MAERIVHIVQHLRPGGLEALALDLVAHAPAGQEAHIVSLEGSREATLAAWPRLRGIADRLHFLEKPPGLRPLAALRLAARLRRLGARGVVTHHVGPLLYGGAAARVARVPALVHAEHDAWHLEEEGERRLMRRLLRWLDPKLVAVSQTVADAICERIPEARPVVIANGIDTSRFCPGSKAEARRSLGLPPDLRLVGCAARLEAVKGHALLLEAMRHLPADVHLALAGIGSLEASLKAQAAALGLAGRMHWLGRVDDMPAFHRASDVFCLASQAEGLPLSPLEAQACGVPVVLTDVGGCHEAVCPATGRLVPAGDAAALALALRLQLERSGSGEPASFVRDRFDIRRAAEAYGALLAAA